MIGSLQVRKTQTAIKHVLTERFYAWEDARKLAPEDKDITFNGNSKVSVKGSYYKRQSYYEEEA